LRCTTQGTKHGRIRDCRSNQKGNEGESGADHAGALHPMQHDQQTAHTIACLPAVLSFVTSKGCSLRASLASVSGSSLSSCSSAASWGILGAAGAQERRCHEQTWVLVVVPVPAGPRSYRASSDAWTVDRGSPDHRFVGTQRTRGRARAALLD